MDVTSLGFRTDLMLRRLAGASVTDRGDHIVVRTPANPTFYWGNFLLTAPALHPRHAGDHTVECRALTSDEDWRQSVELRQAIDEDATEQHVAFLERRAAEARGLARAGHGVYFGAFVDGTVRASLGIVTDGSGLGRYQTVETHPTFRRRGLASALLVAAAEHAREQLHVGTLVIVADPDYVAINLYGSLGFTDAERQVQLQRSPGEPGSHPSRPPSPPA